MESAVDVQALADSLVGGGDTRLLLDDQGLSKYGCTPFPRNTIPFGSCTASTMSLRAWAAAQAGAIRIRQLLKERSSADVADTLCAEIRGALADLLGLSDVPGAEVVLTPSGTDVELIALLLVGDSTDRAVLNIVVGPNEVGSGTTLAAGARHFDDQVPSGAWREVGQAVDDTLAERVTVEPVQLRAADGSMRSPAEIDRAVEQLVVRGIEAGQRVIVHVVAHSKTGVHAPTLGTVNRLVERYGDRVVGLIDAAQGRVSRRGLRTYLRRGYLLMLTGSKFYGGPPFSGALLVPGRLASAMRATRFPDSFGDYFTAAEMPVTWVSAREHLPERANWGLILRWLAALEEMQAYYRTSPEARLAILRHFEREAPRVLRASPVVDMLPVWPPVFSDQTERVLESKTTVFSMKVSVPGHSGPLAKPALKQWVQLLNTDLTERLGLQPSDPGFEAARQPFQIGQPVSLGDSRLAIVRVALGASLITSLAEDQAYGATLDERLGWLDHHLALLSSKMTLMAKRWTGLYSPEHA